MEEYEWQTFVSEWKEYKRERKLTGDGELVAELCESMSKRLLMRISQSSKVFPKNESEMLSSMKNLIVAIHPRIQSIDLLISSASDPNQFLKTLQGQIPNTSLSETPTKEEIIFCSLLLNFKTKNILSLVKGNQIQTAEELVAYVQDEEKKKSKRTRSHSRQRSQSRGRSRSRSILKNRSENMAEDMYGEERGRKRMKGEELRMMTRSRSRAAGAKSVRIRSPSDERFEPELTREKLFDEPSADIPQPQRNAKMRWSWICKHCGK